MSLRAAMNLFDLLFPLGMIGLPAIFAAFVRFKADRPDVAVRRRKAAVLSAALWVATALAAAFVVGTWAAGLAWVARFSWVLFFPLYFGLAWPLSMAKDPAWGARPSPVVRGARLTPRRDPRPAPAWVLAAAVVLWLAVCGFTATTIASADRPGAWALLTVPVSGGFWLFVAGYALWGGFREPEPLPAHGAPELERAYDEFRLWLRRTFFWFGVGGTTVFAVGGLLAAFALRDTLPGWIGGAVGGGLGTAIGIAGAVFGTMGTLKRVRLNRLYREALVSSE